MASCQCRTCEPRAIEGDERNRALPYRGASHRRCANLSLARLWRDAGMSCAARTMTVSTRSFPTIRAAIVIARSVRLRPRANGSRNARPSCCPSPTSMWCSHCRHRSPISLITTSASSTTCCSRRRRKRCSRLPPIPSISAPGSASPPSSTHGVRPCAPRGSCASNTAR